MPSRVLERRQRLEKEIERAFFTLPEASILKSLPGIGPPLGARILIEIGDIRQFRTAAQLAAYAGLGPTPPVWVLPGGRRRAPLDVSRIH